MKLVILDRNGTMDGMDAFTRQAMGILTSSRLADALDLSKEPLALQGRLFRLRQLEMKPGGIVPWHSHADRPALIYIVQGTVTEYASVCKVPIVHRAGDVSVDAGRSHWWKNTGKKKAVLISADIFHAEMSDEHMM